MSIFKTGIHTVFSEKKLPDLRSPYLICGFPGSGYVGKLAVDHLISELKANRLVDIYSSSLPPQIIIRDNGIADLIKNTIYYKAIEGGKEDLLIITGDFQPINGNSEYTLSEEILKISKLFNTKQIVTLGAYITGLFTAVPKVFGTANDNDNLKLLDSNNIAKIETGNVVGMNGLLIGIAKFYEIKGMCLLGETSGYVIDANSSKYLLEKLLNLLEINIDMNELEKKAKDTILLIKNIEEQIGQKLSKGTETQQLIQKKQPEMGYIS